MTKCYEDSKSYIPDLCVGFWVFCRYLKDRIIYVMKSKRKVKKIVWLELRKRTLVMSLTCNWSLCMRLWFLLVSWQITFSLISGYISVLDCRPFIFFIARRLVTWPRIMAWSNTSPFSARRAFLACSTATRVSYQSKLKNVWRNVARYPRVINSKVSSPDVPGKQFGS